MLLPSVPYHGASRFHAFGFLLSLVIAALLAAPCQGQTASSSATDDEWHAIEARAKPSKPSAPTFGTAQPRPPRWYLEQAELAHAFYAKHPSHPKAEEAAKMEVISMLCVAATEQGPTATRVRALASEYRENTTHSTKDRYEVALALEHLKLLVERTPLDESAELAVNEQLQARFRGQPELRARTLALLSTVSSEASDRALSQLDTGQPRDSSDPRLAQARARQKLLRSKPGFALALYPSGTLSSSSLLKPNTVLYFTSTIDARSLPLPWEAPAFSVRKDLCWVAVFTDAPPDEDLLLRLRKSGVLVVDDSTRKHERLRHQFPPGAMPYVFHLDGTGTLIRFGTPACLYGRLTANPR
jgi:hypothetical protein